MAQGWTPDAFTEFVTTTQKRLQKDSWVDITQTLQRHSSQEILKKGNIEFATGAGYQWNVKVGVASSARNVRWGETIDSEIKDYMALASVGWVSTNANYSLSNQAIAANSGPEQLVNMVKVARYACYADLANLMEANLWGSPSSSSDKLNPKGIPFWIQKNANVNGIPGFNGGLPAGFSDVAGIDPTTVTGWKNWTGTYSVPSKSDLIGKLQDAIYNTGFTPPLPFQDTSNGKSENKYRMYTTYTRRKSLEVLLEAQNDNLGKELIPYYNATMFRGMPIISVPYLDQNTTDNAVWGIDWSKWKIVFLKGFFMNESKPMTDVRQPQVQTIHVDLTYEFICLNRQTGGWVLYAA